MLFLIVILFSYKTMISCAFEVNMNKWDNFTRKWFAKWQKSNKIKASAKIVNVTLRYQVVLWFEVMERVLKVALKIVKKLNRKKVKFCNLYSMERMYTKWFG